MKAAQLTENALTVLRERYLWKSPKGSVESSHHMFKRVAHHVAGSSPSLEKRFLASMEELAFLPNSPTLMNAGRKNAQLAACFVLPIPDDLGGIMDSLKWTALIHQSGGGTGFNFSNLRPARAPVASSHGVASGPLGFLSLFNELTQTIKQGGLRRGANMGVLSTSHPDIEEFINCKNDTSKITNFNISVSAPDMFFKTLRAGGEWPLVDPHTRKTVKKISAEQLFKDLCQSAWKTGEPGLIFIDEINRNNPTPSVGSIEATNPCGEQPLLPFEACNLGSINLNVIHDPALGVHWNKLAEIVETGVLFLNRVIDTCHYPVTQIEKLCRSHRKIGLGVMGFADLLLKLRIPYDSPEALELGGAVMEFIRSQAVQVSQQLAKQEGPFEGFSKSLWKKRGVKPLRNATLTTVAPTGTISLIANASAGIEPVFSYAYERNVLDGKKLWEIHPLFEKMIGEKHLDRSQMLKIASEEGTLKNAPIEDEDKKIFVTARDVAPEVHVKVQAEFQKHSDSAVSKTINLPSTATVDDVERAYLLAFDLKCKGITVYRDTSRPKQVLKLRCTDC